MLGGAVAAAIGAGFIPARKPGKLPRETNSVEYVLEYGVGRARGAQGRAGAGGARVLVHDDLLATGGTARALRRWSRTRAQWWRAARSWSSSPSSTARATRPRDVHSLVVYGGVSAHRVQLPHLSAAPAEVWRGVATRPTSRAGGPG